MFAKSTEADVPQHGPSGLLIAISGHQKIPCLKTGGIVIIARI